MSQTPPQPPNLPEDDSRYAPPGARSTQQTEIAIRDAATPEGVPPRSLPRQDEETPAQRALWGCGGALGCMAVVLLVPLILAVVTAGTFAGGIQLLNARALNLFEPPTAGVTSSQTIVNRVQPLGQLVSTSAQVAKADIDVSIAQGALGVCDHSANHVASATIEAGIDLYQIGPEAVTYDETANQYTLRLPRPVITSCSMDFIDQYQRQRNGPTCAVDWDDARQIAQYEALVEFRDEAIEGGLLVTAERDARQALTSFIGALTGSEVIVEFVDVDGTANPGAACEPEPPRDWQQDAITGAWTRTP